MRDKEPLGMQRDFPFKEMVDTLKETLKDEVPVVTKISEQRRGTPIWSLWHALKSQDEGRTHRKGYGSALKKVRKPEDMLAMPVEKLQKLIYPVGFYKKSHLL